MESTHFETKNTISGSFTAVVVLLVLLGIFYLPLVFWESKIYFIIFCVLAAGIGLTVLLEVFISHPYRLKVDDRFFFVKLGLFSSLKKIPFRDIDAILVNCMIDRKKNKVHLASYTPSHDIKTLQRFNSLEFKLKNKKTISMGKHSFNEHDIMSFIAALKSVYFEAVATPLEKLAKIYDECHANLHKDKRLREEIIQATIEAYSTVYQRFTSSTRAGIDEKGDKIVFVHCPNPGSYIFFNSDFMQQGLESDAREIALNLIDSYKMNLEVVDLRINSFQRMLGKLNETRSHYEKREHLEKMAQKLDKIQKKNLGGKDNADKLSLDIEVLNQLEQLTRSIASLDSLENSVRIMERIKQYESASYESID